MLTALAASKEHGLDRDSFTEGIFSAQDTMMYFRSKLRIVRKMTGQLRACVLWTKIKDTPHAIKGKEEGRETTDATSR